MNRIQLVKKVVANAPTEAGQLTFHDGNKFVDTAGLVVNGIPKDTFSIIGSRGGKTVSSNVLIEVNPREFYLTKADPQAAAGSLKYTLKLLKPASSLSNRFIALTVSKVGRLEQPMQILSCEVSIPDSADDAKVKKAITDAVTAEISRKDIQGVSIAGGDFSFTENASYNISAYAEDGAIRYVMGDNTAVSDINTGYLLKQLEREFMILSGENHEFQNHLGDKYFDKSMYNFDEAKRYYSLIISSRRPNQVPLNNFGGLETFASLFFEKKEDRDALYKALSPKEVPAGGGE